MRKVLARLSETGGGCGINRYKAFALILAVLIVAFTTGSAFVDSSSGNRELLDSLLATGQQGTKGRLVFENGHSVALYESLGWDAESIVDAADSAAWFQWYGSQSPIIADHCTQGFDTICDCEVGDVCYIVNGESFTTYECVAIDRDSVNIRTDMFLSDGRSFMRDNEPGFLFMYTCTNEGDPYHITVAIWKETDK